MPDPAGFGRVGADKHVDVDGGLTADGLEAPSPGSCLDLETPAKTLEQGTGRAARDEV